MRSRGRPAVPLVAACLLLVLVALSACGRTSAASDPQASLGPLAGYVWEGGVTSVSGSWTVPRIASSSPDGQGGTWIGAQAPGTRNRAPFVQIGVNEERHPRVSDDYYYAFWSDTRHHFYPVDLFDVQPGDRITAAMALSKGRCRWTLSISDARARATRRFSTADEGAGRFNEGQWLQEHRTKGPSPYLTLADVRFSGLKVNGAPPRYADVYAQWMTLPAGRSLAPSPLAGDRFTLGPATLGEPARRYLRLAAAEDAATAQFAASLARFTAATPVAEIRSAGAKFSTALKRGIRLCRSGPGPCLPATRSDC